MKIRIYQINMDRDAQQKAFLGLQNLEQLFGNRDLDCSSYDKVFEGEVDCSDLESVYQMFNCNHPEGYRGRSLSASDVVEVIEAENTEPGFYFCDSVGFQKVEFDAEQTQDITKPSTIKVVLLEPGKLARIAEIDSSLEGLQKTVGGYIESFYPFEEQVCIVCNDEGKISGLPLNRAIREEDTEVDMSYGEMVTKFREAEKHGEHLEGYVVFTQDSFQKDYSVESRTYKISSQNKAFMPNMGGYSIFGSSLDGSDRGVRLDGYMANEAGGRDGWKIERCYMKERGKEILDIVAGPCFICDCSGEDFGSLSEEQLKRYTEKYRLPEKFARLNGEIIALPYQPETERER